MSELESGFRIADALALLRRQWLVIAVAAAAGLLIGVFVFASAPTTFSATARVEVEAIVGVNDVAGGTGRNPNPVDTATEQIKVKSDDVADAVRKELKLTDGDNRSLLSHVTVTIEPDSSVLQITFEDDTAAGAGAGANATATAYLAQRANEAKATVKTQVDKLSQRKLAASTALNDAKTALAASAPNSPERDSARGDVDQAQKALNVIVDQLGQLDDIDTTAVGSVIRKAPTDPAPVTSKKAIGKGVGVFGLFVLAGLAIAWLMDRRDAFGGGRRRIEAMLPGSTMRILPGSDGKGSAAELDAAIDRLAVDLAAGSGRGRAASVLLTGSGAEPPVALAQELASSLTFAGIPALFVVAGSTDRLLPEAHVVGSFADLLTSPSVTGPAALPETAGTAASSAPLVAWLRPRGSAEASGLLRRAVVEALVTRAGREHYEVVVFVAPAPTRTAAATALGQWVDRTVLVIGDDEQNQAEPAAAALTEADVRVSEVVWT